METHSFFARLDAANNEAEVRTRLAAGNYNTRHAALAQEWLRRREEARSAETAAKSDARADDAISISKRANEIAEKALSVANLQATAAASASSAAREQARWAKWAAILAAIAAITANKDAIFSLIS